MQNTVERKKRSKSAVLTDTLVFVSVLAIFIATLLSIAREVTMLGGKITYGENINLLNFFVGDKGIIGAISNVTENFDSASEEAVLGAFGIIRMFVVLVAAVMHFIIIFIKTICAIVRFAKKDSVKVARTGLSVLSGTIRYFLMLSLFATLSGGMDSGAYAIGYTGGMPLTIALGVLFFAILLMAILRYKENKDKVDKTIDGGKRFTGAIFGALCGAGILVVLNYTYLYGIISGTMFSFITLMAGMVQGGLDILSLLYPILNIVIIVAVMILMKKASGNMKRSLRYALEYGEQVELKTKKPKEYIIKGYVLAIVFSLIAILSVYVLRIPTVGSGWEANVFVQLVAMFILSCVGQTFVSVFTGKKPKTAKDIPTALPKDILNPLPNVAPVIPQVQLGYQGQPNVVVEPSYQSPVPTPVVPIPTPVIPVPTPVVPTPVIPVPTPVVPTPVVPTPVAPQTPVQPVVEQPGIWFCPTCGNKNSGNFCGRCGTKKPQ